MEEARSKSEGTLYLVATPIGNKDDISLRALQVLREADLIVCEELPEGSRFLRQYAIEVPLLDLNEHNEAERTPDVLSCLAEGKQVALISDAGMPVVQDPGEELVAAAVQQGTRVTCVPGPSSITTALALSGLPASRFRYAGYVPAKRDLRRQALAELRSDPDTIVLAEAPYRLMPLLEDVAAIVGASRRLVIGCDLTTKQEMVYRGTAGSLLRHFREHPYKGEFVIVMEGAGRPRAAGRRGASRRKR